MPQLIDMFTQHMNMIQQGYDPMKGYTDPNNPENSSLQQMMAYQQNQQALMASSNFQKKAKQITGYQLFTSYMYKLLKG